MKANIFVTCLVEQLFPQVGIAMVEVLERLGVEVDFPKRQSCCGQPAFNMGHREEARRFAKSCLEIFADSEYVVVPSGSCVSMIRHQFPELVADSAREKILAKSLAQRCYEFSQFIIQVLHVRDVGAYFPKKVTYHDSCHLRRSLGIYEEPRELIRAVRGIEFIEMKDSDVCCGFGGAFSIKMPHLSTAMMEDKLANITASQAEYLIAADSGCLMNIGGGASRKLLPLKVLHLAELLAQR